MSNRKEKSILLLIIMKNELLKQQFRLKRDGTALIFYCKYF